MELKYKKVGVWEFGIAGKAVVDYLYQQSAQLAVVELIIGL